MYDACCAIYSKVMLRSGCELSLCVSMSVRYNAGDGTVHTRSTNHVDLSSTRTCTSTFADESVDGPLCYPTVGCMIYWTVMCGLRGARATEETTGPIELYLAVTDVRWWDSSAVSQFHAVTGGCSDDCPRIKIGVERGALIPPDGLLVYATSMHNIWRGICLLEDSRASDETYTYRRLLNICPQHAIEKCPLSIQRVRSLYLWFG